MSDNHRKLRSELGESPSFDDPSEIFEMRVPKYLRHKKRYARVILNGREVHLGTYGSPESKANYERVVAEWLQSGRKTPKPKRQPEVIETGPPSVTELIVKFIEHADVYYRRPDGTPTREADNIRDALRSLKRLFGNMQADTFGPANLKTFQSQLVRDGLSRTTVNKRVGIVRRMMKWAAREGLIPASIAVELNVVEGLRQGRTKAKEPEPVRPVSEADILAIQEHVSPIVWAMVQLQLATAMRPSEVCRLRSSDIDTSSPVWEYRPPRHKTEHHGKIRRVFIGPKGQAALVPWLCPEQPDDPVFSPNQAVVLHRARMRERRKSPVQPSQKDRSKSEPRIKPGEFYRVSSYARAIYRACIKAGVSPWSPNRLRHSSATYLRQNLGIEAARVVLGHSAVNVTEIYAEPDAEKAREAMSKFG